MSTQENITVRDFAIGVLSVTAVILLTALLVGHALLPRQAMAYAQSTSAGGYLVTTSQVDDSAELLLILNTKTYLGLLFKEMTISTIDKDNY